MGVGLGLGVAEAVTTGSARLPVKELPSQYLPKARVTVRGPRRGSSV